MSASGPTFDWRQVDHALANLMLDEVSEEIRKRIEEDERQIRAENHGNQNALAFPLRRLQMQVLHTDECCWVLRSEDTTLSLDSFPLQLVRLGVTFFVS